MKENLVSAFDLDDFENLEQAVLTIKNPITGEPTSASITLASKEHPFRKKIDMSRARKLRSAYLRNGNKMPNTDPLEEFDEETDYLVGVTIGWNLTQGGKELKLTPESARALYTDSKKVFVREQVLEALNKNELFIQNSVKA
ncbi:MAG: hypothetical protein V4570_03455 [Pseudomonadota bacterium]